MFSLGPTEIGIMVVIALLTLGMPLAVVLLVIWLVRRQARERAPRGE